MMEALMQEWRSSVNNPLDWQHSRYLNNGVRVWPGRLVLSRVYPRMWDLTGPPAALNEVYITMIPKSSTDPDPLLLRPTAVEPIMIRLWTGIKVRAWAQSIAEAIPWSQHGGVPGCSAYQLVMELAVDIEQAKHTGHTLLCISYGLHEVFRRPPTGSHRTRLQRSWS